MTIDMHVIQYFHTSFDDLDLDLDFEHVRKGSFFLLFLTVASRTQNTMKSALSVLLYACYNRGWEGGGHAWILNKIRVCASTLSVTELI